MQNIERIGHTHLIKSACHMTLLLYLEIDDDGKHEHGGDHVHQVGKILTVECLSQSTNLVRTSSQQVKECNDSSLKLCPTAGVDGGRTEGLPDNSLTDVGSYEQTDPRTKTVTLLEELIKEQEYQPCKHKLREEEKRRKGRRKGEGRRRGRRGRERRKRRQMNERMYRNTNLCCIMSHDHDNHTHLEDYDDADANPNVRGWSVHPCHHVHHCLTHGNEHSKHWGRGKWSRAPTH